MDIHQKFFSKIGVNYLIYAIISLVFQIILINIVGYLNPNILNNFNLFVILSAFCNYVLPLPILMFLMKKLETRQITAERINIATFIKYICITFTLMWIGNIIGLAITYGLGNIIQSDISNPVHELINSSDIWLNLILVSVIGPIFEEFIFRKLLIDRTIKYGARVSIILSAVMFAFFHGNLNQFFYALFMGGFFAYVYIKTGKLTYTIILHILVNFMGSVISLIVAQCATALTQGTYVPLDLGIILIYFVFLATAMLVGLISLLSYKKSKFMGSKTEISLKQPLKTMFLNYGMIAFFGFFILEMIYQIIG